MILLVHGWGYDAAIWDGVAAQLPDLPLRRIDLGFFGKPDLGPLPQGCLGVGHSLGFLWLLKNALPNCAGLLAINGFPRFVAGPDFPEGIAPRLLDRMKTRLAENPHAVLDEFHRRVGAPGPGGDADPQRLAMGLDWLRLWDGRRDLADFDRSYRALIGTEDDLLGPDLAASGFPADRLARLAGSHALPVTAPALVAAAIRQCWMDFECAPPPR